jgi:MoxR-like ATPase
MKNRINELIAALSDGLYERQEIVAVSLLATLSGQSIFLYGLPGTAKSLIARRLSKAFKDSTHFEYLMQRFSTPEDVFGPVSIQELKQDKYIRKTQGYLPTADFAFLDEIWKSSPAILNTLLTIINERIFRNGEKEEKVPLKALIAASNETPPPNQGLDALYDRFVMRVIVNPMKERTNFEGLLDGDAVLADIEIDDQLQFSHDEWASLLAEIPKVKISREVMDIINSVRVSLEEYNENNKKHAVYVSDRRWQKIALVLKTSAYLCDRHEVIPVDALVIRHCLWTLEENRKPIEEIIEKCVKEFVKPNREELVRWLANSNDLEKCVAETFFYTENIYVTVQIGDLDCIADITPPINTGQYGNSKNSIRIYCSTDYLDTNTEFSPLLENGSQETKLRCNFNGGKNCKVQIDTDVKRYGWNSGYQSKRFEEWFDIKPKVSFAKGTAKDVIPRTKKTFVTDCKASFELINEIIRTTTAYINIQNKNNETSFIPDDKRQLVLTALHLYLQELENHKLNAEHLLSKVESHAVSK